MHGDQKRNSLIFPFFSLEGSGQLMPRNMAAEAIGMEDKIMVMSWYCERAWDTVAIALGVIAAIMLFRPVCQDNISFF